MSIVNDTSIPSGPSVEEVVERFRTALAALRSGRANSDQQELMVQHLIDLENELALWQNASQIHGFKP